MMKPTMSDYRRFQRDIDTTDDFDRRRLLLLEFLAEHSTIRLLDSAGIHKYVETEDDYVNAVMAGINSIGIRFEIKTIVWPEQYYTEQKSYYGKLSLNLYWEESIEMIESLPRESRNCGEYRFEADGAGFVDLARKMIEIDCAN